MGRPLQLRVRVLFIKNGKIYLLGTVFLASAAQRTEDIREAAMPVLRLYKMRSVVSVISGKRRASGRGWVNDTVDLITAERSKEANRVFDMAAAAMHAGRGSGEPSSYLDTAWVCPAGMLTSWSVAAAAVLHGV
eukprot:GHVU01073519.1.p1 GENE.GHVU01073519.1~~GHVU01073519.1.p1  ORF type:complete len:134 (-),score=16.11 GHVU01073519.1:1076-1477(-)